jgi:hypothetical protein
MSTAMVKLTIERNELNTWLELAMETNSTFFRVRKDLFDQLAKSLTREEDGSGDSVTMSLTIFNQIKNYLTSRNENLNEPKQLAYTEALTQLTELLNENGQARKLGKQYPSQAQKDRRGSDGHDDGDSKDNGDSNGGRQVKKESPKVEEV